MSLLEFLLLLMLWFAYLQTSLGQNIPIQGLVQDKCLLSEYLSENGDCVACPSNCEQCYLKNNEVRCSTCPEGFYFSYDQSNDLEQCVQQCPVGYKYDFSMRQCISCKIRFCADCSFEESIACSFCQEGYQFDAAMNICSKTCAGQQLFDTLSGQCVDQCSEDKTTFKATCISNISCPNKQNIQNVCSVSSISLVILHPDGNTLIAVGINNISMFALPNFILQKTHTLVNANSIVNCKILSENQSFMYCFNSAEQILKFSLDDLTETTLINSQGFFVGEESNFPGYWEDNIIVAGSDTILEKIDILTAFSSSIEIPPDLVNAVYSVTYWKERDLVANVIQNLNGKSILLLFSPSLNSLQQIAFTGTNSFVAIQRITSIDKYQVIFYSTSSLIYCQVNVAIITSGNDFICIKKQVVSFPYSKNGDLKLYKQQGILILFSSVKSSSTIFDCSVSFQSIKVLTTITGVISYTVQDNYVFYVTSSSTIMIISLKPDPTGISFSISQSFSILKSFASQLKGVVFSSKYLYFYDQQEVFSIDISLDPSKTAGQLATTILQNQRQIPFSQSSKCEINYLPDVLLNTYREDIGYLVFIYQYSVKFVPIRFNAAYIPFEISLNIVNGSVEKSQFSQQYRKLVIYQTSVISIIDLQLQKIVYQLTGYISYMCGKVNFQDQQQLSIICFDSNYYSDTLTIVAFSNLAITKIPVSGTRKYNIQNYGTQYFYVYEASKISKYNSTGSLIQTFTALPCNVSESTSVLDNDVQVRYLHNLLVVYDLVNQKIIDSRTIPEQLDDVPLDQVFLFQNTVKGFFFSGTDTITLFSYPISGSVTQKSFSCPGHMNDLRFIQFHIDAGIAVYQSQSEAILCIIDLASNQIQYLENEDISISMGTFTSSDGVYFYVARKGMTEIFQKKSATSSSSNKFLLKIMDLLQNCASMRQYNQNTGICINADLVDSVFFPLANKYNVDIINLNYPVVVKIKFVGIFFILQGTNKVILANKQNDIFSYEKTGDKYNYNEIKDVFFDEETRQILIVWQFDVVDQINTITNETVNSFEDYLRYIIYSPKIHMLVYYYFRDNNLLELHFFDVRLSIMKFTYLLDYENYDLQPILDESGEVLFLLRNNQIYRFDLSIGSIGIKQYQILNSFPISIMISTKKTLILISADFSTAFMIDFYSLQLNQQPTLPSDKEENKEYNFSDIKFSLITLPSSNEDYFILDVSYLQKIVVFSVVDLSVIQTIQYHMKYVVLDIDTSDHLICTLSTDSFILIHEYSTDAKNSSNPLPLYSISFKDYIMQSTSYKGISFLSKVKAKIIAKYQLLITSLDNIIRIHSLKDGLLRFLIEDSTLVVEQFMVYLNNYLIVYGNQQVRVFNIEHAFFMKQEVTFLPLKIQSYQIPISNGELLSQQELDLLGVSFPMRISCGAQDPQFYFMFQGGEKVQVIDDRYSIKIDSQLVLKESETSAAGGEDNSIEDQVFEAHRIYYISKVNILNGVQGQDVFKRILLANGTASIAIVKHFFVSRNYVTIVNVDYVNIFSLDLMKQSTFQFSSAFISRVLAIPSEINADRFIFISTDSQILYFDLALNSTSLITPISGIRGQLSYYFFLASETHRVLVIGFSDQSVLTIDLDSFVGTWMEASASVPSQILSTVRRLFASKQFLYLVDDSKHINVFKFTISSTLNSLGLQESVISFSAVTKIDSMTIEQFFFDVTKERLIFFISNSSYVYYAVLKSIILDQSSPSTMSYELSITESPILKPSFDSSTLHINPTLDLYIFYGNSYILIIHRTEMKMRAFISDTTITGAIKAAYALTYYTLVVTTDTNIFTLVFLAPQGLITSMYYVANIIEFSHATILFYRYQQPINFTSKINIILEGVSDEGAFNIEYPIDLQDSQSPIKCGISFSFTSNQVSSQLFLTSLNEIDNLNKSKGIQSYDIENFRMVFVDGIDNFYKYLNRKYYNFFRMQGWNREIILWIFPQSDFSVITGKNFHLKQFILMFLRFPTDILLLNKYFTYYLTLIMEEIQFKQDNLGYYFTFQSIGYVLLKDITFSPAIFAQDSSLAPTSLFNSQNNQNRLLQETGYELAEEKLFITLASTTYCTFWNSTDQAELNKLSISSIVLYDFQSMFSFLNCNKAIVQSIQAVGIEMKQRFYENQQIMLFIKVTTAIIQDVLFQNVVLNDVSLMRFHDISNLTIVNLNFTNITCTAAASSTENPQFLLEFLGIQSLNIQGLYFQDIKNCFLVNAQQYKLENVLKSNSVFTFNNTIFKNISFNNIAAVVSSNSSALRQLTGESEEIKIATPSLLALTVTDLVIQNSNINDCNIKYTTLMNVASASIQIENVQIGNTHLTIPSSLTYPSPAINLSCGTLIASKLSLADNSQVDFALTATSEATFTELTVKGNSNSANNYKGDISGMVSISSTKSLSISNSVFESNTGYKYSTGGLYLNTITQFLISDCKFLNNTANSQAGGGLAIYYSSGVNNIIQNSIFKENKSPQHSGGGIYALTSDFKLTGCSYYDNSALIGGGIRISSSIQYVTFMTSFNSSLSFNTYEGNQASIYGNDVGLFPAKIINAQDLTRKTTIDLKQRDTEYQVNNFKSGDSLSDLSFAILDNQGRSISFNNYSSSNIHQQVINEISKFSFSWSANNTKNIFIPQGSISFNKTTNLFDIFLNLYITPSITESISIISASTYPTVDPHTLEFSLQPLLFEIIVVSRLCQIGEVYQGISSVYQCFSCPEGKYSFVVPSLKNINTVTCKICPPQALNCTLNQMYLLNGYWRENDISDEIYSCTKSKMNCKAQEPTSKELCGEGSIGPLCQSCDIYGRLWGESYSRFTDQSCKKCSQIFVSYVILLVLIGIVLAYILMIVWQNCKAIKRKIKAITIIKLGLVRMGRSAIFDQFTTLQKIFMNYLLFIFILTEMDFALSSNIKLISIGGDPISNITHSLDCFLAKLSGMNIIYWRVVWIFMFSQLIASIVMIVFILAYFLLLKKMKKAQIHRLSVYRSKKIHKVESSTLAPKAFFENNQSNLDRIKLKSEIQKDAIIFSQSIEEQTNLDDKPNNNIIDKQSENKHQANNLEKFKDNPDTHPLETTDFLLLKMQSQSQQQQQQQQLQIQQNQLLTNLKPKQTDDSKLKGNILAVQGDDNPIEIEELHLEQEDTLKEEDKGNIKPTYQQSPQNPQIQLGENQKFKGNTDQKDLLEKYDNHSQVQNEVFNSEENNHNKNNADNFKNTQFGKEMLSREKVNTMNIHNTESFHLTYSGLLNQKEKSAMKTIKFEDTNENSNNTPFLKSQQQFTKFEVNKGNKLAFPNTHRNSFQQIIGSNSQPFVLGKSSGLEMSMNVPYFRVESKYFQWYSGYIWMSMKLLFFYLQPGIVKMLLSILSCEQIGSKKYIYADPQFLCDTEYRIISTAAILPVLLILCFIIPLKMFRQLKLNQLKQSSYTFLKSYGFFFQEYKSKAYYWEIFRMATKTMISCVLVFYSSSIELKLILTILIISFYIFLQLRVQPYKTRSFNELDYLSNAVVVMSLILGLLIYSTDIIWLRAISGLSMFAINTLFVWRICKEILLTITLPWDESQRTLIHRLLYFLHVRIPYIFGMISVQKSYSCKIFIMWKKLSLYVHHHKNILIQQSQSQKKLEEAKSLLLSCLRIDPENEFNLKDNYFNESKHDLILNNNKDIQGLSSSNLKIFNENMLEQLKKISSKLNSTLEKSDSLNLNKNLNSPSLQSSELQSIHSLPNSSQTHPQLLNPKQSHIIPSENPQQGHLCYSHKFPANNFKFLPQDNAKSNKLNQQQNQIHQINQLKDTIQLEEDNEEEKLNQEVEDQEEEKYEIERDQFSEDFKKHTWKSKQNPSQQRMSIYSQSDSIIQTSPIHKPQQITEIQYLSSSEQVSSCLNQHNGNDHTELNKQNGYSFLTNASKGDDKIKGSSTEDQFLKDFNNSDSKKDNLKGNKEQEKDQNFQTSPSLEKQNQQGQSISQTTDEMMLLHDFSENHSRYHDQDGESQFKKSFRDQHSENNKSNSCNIGQLSHGEYKLSLQKLEQSHSNQQNNNFLNQIKQKKSEDLMKDNNTQQGQEWDQINPNIYSQLGELKAFEEKKTSVFLISQNQTKVSQVLETDILKKDTQNQILSASPSSSSNSIKQYPQEKEPEDILEICSEHPGNSSASSSQIISNNNKNTNIISDNELSNNDIRLIQAAIQQSTNQTSSLVASSPSQNASRFNFSKITKFMETKNSPEGSFLKKYYGK